MTINSIRQGETFGFTTGLTGSGIDGFTSTFSVMQRPKDTPAITRSIVSNKDSLTSAETAALAVGQWFIYITSSDADENIQEPVKVYIAQGWN